jgi:hypothetical protein
MSVIVAGVVPQAVVVQKMQIVVQKSSTKWSLSFATSQQRTNGQGMPQKRGTQVHEKRL